MSCANYEERMSNRHLYREIEEELRQIINENGVRGVDRIVPVGHAADIAFVWDGLDLPDILSRRIGNM